MEKISNDVMNAIVAFMDDEIREELHRELAPCTNEQFLSEYVNRVPEFNEFLKNEFGIEL